MPTEIETTVLKLLSAIEIQPEAGQTIEALGNEAVTTTCEVALGSYAGLRKKLRMNATALLGRMLHPQAKESLNLLVKNADQDIATAALRASGVLGDESIVPALDELLADPATPNRIAAESVKALNALKEQATANANACLQGYLDSDPSAVPHRNSQDVQAVLLRLQLE